MYLRFGEDVEAKRAIAIFSLLFVEMEGAQAELEHRKLRYYLTIFLIPFFKGVIVVRLVLKVDRVT